jgi:hypothetical protein
MLLPPAPGHEWYLPEIYWTAPALPRERAIPLTAHHLARWADRCFARRTVASPGFTSGSLPFQVREERLPTNPCARQEAIDELLRWLQDSDDGTVSFNDVALNCGDRSVLNAHDGFPGVLHLTPRQYASVRRAWRAHDLPEDLYYPASASGRWWSPSRSPASVPRVGCRAPTAPAPGNGGTRPPSRPSTSPARTSGGRASRPRATRSTRRSWCACRTSTRRARSAAQRSARTSSIPGPRPRPTPPSSGSGHWPRARQPELGPIRVPVCRSRA